MAEMKFSEADLRQIITLDAAEAWRVWKMLFRHSPGSVQHTASNFDYIPITWQKLTMKTAYIPGLGSFAIKE